VTPAVLAAFVTILGAFLFKLTTGYLPSEAAGFSLIESRTFRADAGLGPPVSDRDVVNIVDLRSGVYAHDPGLVEARVTEVDTSGFSTRELLRAQNLDRATLRWTTTRVDGVSFTCGGDSASRRCFWATSSHFGSVSTMGPRHDRRPRSPPSAGWRSRSTTPSPDPHGPSRLALPRLAG
jgi:hypothetical protein